LSQSFIEYIDRNYTRKTTESYNSQGTKLANMNVVLEYKFLFLLTDDLEEWRQLK